MALHAVHLGLEVALREVRLDRRRQRGKLILLRFDACRMVLRSSSSAFKESARSARACHLQLLASDRRSEVHDRDSRAGAL